jgi:hypothetical protein
MTLATVHGDRAATLAVVFGVASVSYSVIRWARRLGPAAERLCQMAEGCSDGRYGLHCDPWGSPWLVVCLGPFGDHRARGDLSTAPIDPDAIIRSGPRWNRRIQIRWISVFPGWTISAGRTPTFSANSVRS